MTCSKTERLDRIKRNLERIENLMQELQRMSIPIDEGRNRAQLVVLDGNVTEHSESNS